MQCLGFMHAWDPDKATVHDLPSGGCSFMVQCSRCGTRRFEVLDRYGQLVVNSRRYDPPDDYKGGYEAPLTAYSRAEWRRMALDTVNHRRRPTKEDVERLAGLADYYIDDADNDG